MLAGNDTNTVLDAVIAPPPPEDRERMEAAMKHARRRPWKVLRPVQASTLRRWRPGRGFSPLSGLLPSGLFPTFSLARFPGVTDFRQWPAALWVTSLRVDDGEVVVFGRDRTDVSVIDAMEASGAVPGMLEPKVIGAERFVDGAVASASQAHLLKDEPLDLVVVSSPMTRPGRGPVKVRARWQLANEVAQLRRTGVRVAVVEPDDEVMAAAEGFPRENRPAGPVIAGLARSMTRKAVTPQ